MSPLARAADIVIRGYQLLLRPALPGVCRFEPSCSAYAREALAARGFLRGLGLALWRLLRCHPFHPGGYDPPPVAAPVEPQGELLSGAAGGSGGGRAGSSRRRVRRGGGAGRPSAAPLPPRVD